MRTHLSHTLFIFTNTCLPHGKPYVIKPNFILDISVLCMAMLSHTMHLTHVHASLPFCHCHVLASCSYLDMPFSDSIDRFGTNMYIHYNSIAKESTGNPSLILLEFHPLKRLDQLPTFISNSSHLLG